MKRISHIVSAAVFWIMAQVAAATAADVVIALDPGHGGGDPGAIAGGVLEKDLVLSFAQALARSVDRKPGLSAMLTRSDDSFVPLAERVRRARWAGAHVLISIHADALANGEASGVSVYSLSPAAAVETAKLLVEKAPRSDVIAGAALAGQGDDIAHLLVDLAQRSTLHETQRLADAVLDGLQARTDLLPTRPHRRAGFRVLMAPEMPSILVELGFLSTDQDRERLTSKAWQRRAAEGLATGVASWAATAPIALLTPKPWRKVAECGTENAIGGSCAPSRWQPEAAVVKETNKP
ncbi:MAG: N-acetylmuramoyl-L-alanine amidase [Pseudomonadota bacterium]